MTHQKIWNDTLNKYEMIHWINMKWYYWKAMVKTLKKRASMAGSAVCPLENNPLSIISHFYNLCLPIFVKYICSICKTYFSKTLEHICKIHNTYFRNSPLSMISHFYNLCLPIFVQVLLKWLLRPISCMFWTNLAPPISLPLQWNFKKNPDRFHLSFISERFHKILSCSLSPVSPF